MRSFWKLHILSTPGWLYMDSDNIWEMPSYYMDMAYGGSVSCYHPTIFWHAEPQLVGEIIDSCGEKSLLHFQCWTIQIHTNTTSPQKKTCIQCVEFHRRSWSGSVVGNTKEIAERFHTSPPQFASKMRCNVLVDYVPGFFQKSIVTPMSGTTQS